MYDEKINFYSLYLAFIVFFLLKLLFSNFLEQLIAYLSLRAIFIKSAEKSPVLQIFRGIDIQCLTLSVL